MYVSAEKKKKEKEEEEEKAERATIRKFQNIRASDKISRTGGQITKFQ